MNLVSFNCALFALLAHFLIFTHAQPRLVVEKSSVDYVIDETILITVTLEESHSNQPVLVFPNYEPNNKLINCTHCEPVILSKNAPIGHFLWKAIDAGGLTIYFTINNSATRYVDIDNAFAMVTIGKAHWIHWASQIAGWSYFLLWIFSMYPQLVINHRRHSVVGLNFDYIAFSLIGYAAYAVYNCSLYYVPYFQDAYMTAYPHSNLPVQLNDVFFSVHGVIATLAVVIQCFIMERGDQKLSTIGKSIVNCVIVCIIVISWGLYIGRTTPLRFVYFFSYIKIALTIAKYVPQAIFNYQRKSTNGWSIYNILLDLNGGIQSILQMLLLSINYNDTKYFTNNVAKLCVGMISIMFDILFMTQHYCLYGSNQEDLEKNSIDNMKHQSDSKECLANYMRKNSQNTIYGINGQTNKAFSV